MASHGWRVVFTGTEAEAARYRGRIGAVEGAVDAGGKLSLDGLMALLGSVDAVVASSTGPLHLAAALGTPCVGLYGMTAPVWPERWRPIGPQADWIAVTEEAPEGGLAIPVDAVVDRLLQLRRKIP